MQIQKRKVKKVDPTNYGAAAWESEYVKSFSSVLKNFWTPTLILAKKIVTCILQTILSSVLKHLLNPACVSGPQLGFIDKNMSEQLKGGTGERCTNIHSRSTAASSV